METWGELFWDAWIRFRLWCRSVRRLYWPPRIEAWQVCTVTGVAAIVLTVLSLRNQIGSSAHAGQPIADKTPNQAPSKQLSSKKSQSKLASTPAVEPYEMAQIVDGATPVDTEITLEDPNTKTDSAPPKPDSEFDDIGPSRPPRTDLRHAARPGKLSTALDTPASDSTAGVDTAEPESEQGSPKATVDGTTDLELKDTSNSVPDPKEIDTAVRSRIAVKPSAEQFESAPDISDVQMPDKELPNKESGDTAESALDRLPKSKVTLDVAGDEQSAEGATPAKLLPARDPGHYTRSHHEEDEPVNSEVPVARRKKIEFAAPAPAPKSIVRSKGHYTSFGDDEPAADAKSDAVIPTRQTNVVPPAPPESNEPDVVESVAKEPAEPDMPKAPNADTEDFEVPKVPTKRAPRVAVPMDEQPQFEPPARELSLPPAESDVMLTPEAEPDDGPHPPILIAPEEEFENPGVTPPVSEQPVLRSATPPEFDEQKTNVDAEAITTNRRTPPVVENSQPTKTVAPVTGDDSENEPVPPLPNKRFQGPVLSTDSVDHEAHLNEDVFNGGKRKQRDIPNLPPAKSIDYHGPVLSTGAADHEAHQAEDSISGGNSKTDNKTNGRNWPTAKAVKPSLEHQARQPVSTEPAENEKINAEPAGPAVEPEADPGVVTPPVATPKEPAAALKPTRDYDSAEPATSRRTAPRTAPRSSPQIIGHDTDAAETTSPITRTFEPVEVATPPMPELTQPRGPARIAVPQRIPQPEDSAAPNPRTRALAPPSAPPAIPQVAPQAAPRVAAAPRLEMEITGPRKAPVGTQVVLHFKIKNVGNAPATGIMVSDVLPPGLQHPLSPDLEYTISRLMPGETRETNLTVLCTTQGVITNRAALTADGDVTAEATVQVEVTGNPMGAGAAAPGARPPLTVTHRGPERWLVDSTGQFLVTVTNVSGQRLRDVTITETYPIDTNLIHATVGHKADAQNRTVCWTISDFAPGQAYILETELHSTGSGPQTTTVKVKMAGIDVAEDRWTAVSYPDGVSP